MSYVCLWSPSWPTGADFPADLVASLLAHAPRVAVGERSLVWGDARGLHGGQLAEAMQRVAGDYGFDDVRAGVAMTPVAAEVAATRSETPLLVVPVGKDRSFIAPSPLAVLSPPEQLAALVKGLGIETVGAFAELDAESVEIRLGVEGVRLWQRARADDERFLFKIPLRALPSASVEWVEYGLKDPERLQFVINSLAATVCTSLVSRGERAREMALVFALGNRTQRTHIIRSSRPSAEQKRWMRLVREALDTLTLPDAVMGVTLRVESVTGNEGAQGDLFDRGFASAPMVEDAIVQLTDDQGDVVVEAVNSRHPLLEERTTWKGLGSRGLGRGMSGIRPSTLDPRPSLTLQLLPTPKTITVSTESRRDHDVPVRYLDGSEWHDIVEAAGPDRVSGGQWQVKVRARVFPLRARGRDDGLVVSRVTAADVGLVSPWMVGLTQALRTESNMTQLTGTFDMMGWEEQPYDAAEGLPKLTHADVTHALHGDIEGEASVTYLMGYRPDGSASFVGLIRVVGAVGARQGSFVMQDVGTYENAIARGRWTIVPGLGTGMLREIRGNGHFAAAEDSATYLLDVSF